MSSAKTILRTVESGRDQLNQAIAEPMKKDTKMMAKARIALRRVGGAGGDGISSNIAISVYLIVNVNDERKSADSRN